MNLKNIYSILNRVLENKVFYIVNVYDNEDNASMPYIVYQELYKRPAAFHDNKPIFYVSTIQISLVTKHKDIALETKLEQELLKNGYCFSLISEAHNSDKSLTRVYEIKMEEF